MRSKPVAFLLADLGVTKTHSRPYTSSDNPYSEAGFKTLKYRPEFPDRFDTIEPGRTAGRSSTGTTELPTAAWRSTSPTRRRSRPGFLPPPPRTGLDRLRPTERARDFPADGSPTFFTVGIQRPGLFWTACCVPRRSSASARA